MPLLILSLIIGTVLCFPSAVLDLRVQEGIFPLVAAGVFIAFLIFWHINSIIGSFILFLLAVCVWQFTPQSFTAINCTIIYAGLFYAVVNIYPRIEAKIGWLYNAICLLSLLNVLWIFLQYTGVYIIFILRDSTHYTGFFANRIETSIFLATSVPFFFRRKWWPFLIPVGISLVMLKSTNGILCASIGVAAVLGYWLWKEYKKVVIPLLAGIALCGVITAGFMFTVHVGNWGDRFAVNKEAIKLIAAKPILGWGMGQGQFIIPLFLNAEKQEPKLRDWQYQKVIYQTDLQHLYNTQHNKQNTIQEWFRELHNDYLQLAVEIGLTGLVLFALSMLSVFFAAYETKSRDYRVILSLFILLFSAGAFFTFQIGRFVFMTVILAGLIQGARQCQED